MPVSDSVEIRLEENFKNGKITFSDSARKQYAKSNGIVGNHSGVQICLWNKKVLRGDRGCYKAKFYGVQTHRCAQISPALAWCNEACIFCWRPMEWMKKTKFEESEVDEPKEILDGVVAARRKLLSGFGAWPDRKKFNEAFELFPSHWAISLSCEPTIYPKLGEMVRLLRETPEVKTIFIVTNGQEPERLRALSKTNSLPTQIYLSLAAYDEESFKKINRSVYADGWERLMETISLFADLPCRRVIRLTLIRGVNDTPDAALTKYAKIIETSQTDFVEIKSFMALGFSRKRLGSKHMADMDHVRAFAQSILEHLPNYHLEAEDGVSFVLLLKRNDSKYENIISKC